MSYKRKNIPAVDTPDDLRKIKTVGSNFPEHQTIYLLGTTTRNQGGEGAFNWNASGTGTDDGVFFIRPDDYDGAGVWQRVGELFHDKVADYSVDYQDMTAWLTNNGATGDIVMTLPVTLKRITFRFLCLAAFKLTVRFPSGTTGFLGDQPIDDGGSIYSAAPGSFIEIKAHSSSAYFTKTSQGDWTVAP